MKYNRLTLKWLDYNMYKPQIQILRKTVFMEEQGLEDFVLDSPIDEKGLHLGLFSGDNLVSSVSLFPFRSDDHFIRELGIESKSEEHTSELQSRENIVCRLLLE